MANLPPGLAGWVLADQQRGQKEAQQIGMLGAFAQLQNHALQQQLLPLKMKQLQAQVAEAETMGGILRQYMGAQGPLGALTAGAAVGDVGPTVTNQARIGNTGGGGSPMQLPDQVKLALLHPRLAALGKVQAEAFKPTDKMRELVARGVQPGSPQWNAELGTHFNQGGAWQIDPQGNTRLAGGYAQGTGDVERAQQQARAAFDLVTVPPTSPGAHPRQVTREQRVQEVTPIQATAPTPEAGRQAALDAMRANPGRGVSVTVPNTAIPTSAIVPGAAGMTPNQETRVAADKAFETEAAQGSAKSATALTDNALKAENNIATIDALRVAAQEVRAAGGKTGAFQPMVQRATEIAQGMGIDPATLGLPKDAGPYQVLEALTNKMALGLIGVPGGMPANLFSEADRKFVQSSVAQRTDTEQGFNAKLDMFEKLYKRGIEQEQSWLRAKEEGKSFNQWRMEWSRYVNENPVFSGAPPKPTKPTQAPAVTGYPKPTQQAIGRLKMNPKEKAQFEEIFGPGSADQYVKPVR